MSSFIFTLQLPLWAPCRFFFYKPVLLPPFPGVTAVSVGEGVPGACLLPPPHGPGSALPVARPDDALPLGQHHRPREVDSVSPGLCH